MCVCGGREVVGEESVRLVLFAAVSVHLVRPRGVPLSCTLFFFSHSFSLSLFPSFSVFSARVVEKEIANRTNQPEGEGERWGEGEQRERAEE